MKTAILLIGHGSRISAANDALHAIAAMVRANSDFAAVRVCFREQHSESIQKGIDACVALGAGRILLYPYFLFTGTHVLEDLPREMQKAAERYPELELALAEPLGIHPKLAEIVCQRITEGMVRAGWTDDPQS